MFPLIIMYRHSPCKKKKNYPVAQCRATRRKQIRSQCAQRWKIHPLLKKNNIPAKINSVPYFEDDVTRLQLGWAAAHPIIDPTIHTVAIYHEVTYMTSRCLFFISFSFDPYCMNERSHEQAARQSHNATNPLWKTTTLLYTALLRVHVPIHTVCAYTCVCAQACENVIVMNWIAMMQWGDHLHTSLTLGAFSILSPLFITFSSFLLTCAVRGNIHLSDSLCDPPPGLAWRGSAVNINIHIIPGSMAGTEQPWPPWIFIRDHKPEPSARLKTSPWSAFHSYPPQKPWSILSAVLVLDCFDSTSQQAQGVNNSEVKCVSCTPLTNSWRGHNKTSARIKKSSCITLLMLDNIYLRPLVVAK